MLPSAGLTGKTAPGLPHPVVTVRFLTGLWTEGPGSLLAFDQKWSLVFCDEDLSPQGTLKPGSRLRLAAQMREVTHDGRHGLSTAKY